MDFDMDEIMTIQWQGLDGFTGRPIGELTILTSWESSEREIVKTFIPNLKCNWWDFILVGKNLTFEFCFLSQKMEQYDLGRFDFRNAHERALVDLKPILVMMNNGRFKGFDQIIPKTNPTRNDQIPALYKEGKYDQVIQYIRDEADDFIKAYQILKVEMPRLRNLLA